MIQKFLKTWQKFLQALAAKGSACGLLAGLLPALLCLYLGFVYLVAPRRQANLERQAALAALAAVEAEIAKGRAVIAGEQAFKEEFARVVGLFYESLPLLPGQRLSLPADYPLRGPELSASPAAVRLRVRFRAPLARGGSQRRLPLAENQRRRVP